MPYLGQAVFPSKTAEAWFGGGGLRPHLGLVISDPAVNAERVVFVTVSSTEDGCDRSCVLTREDHESLDHESFVFYKITQRLRDVSSADMLERAYARDWFRPRPDLRPEVLRRIQQAAFESPFLAPWAEDVLAAQGFKAA